MAHPYHHALSSVRRWGGKVEDYQPIHDWFDESKAFLADIRHRALRHHAEGIFLCERVFGVTITNSDRRVVPVRWIGEQHVKEDLGRIPAASDWLRAIRPEPWMLRTGVSRMCEETARSEPATDEKGCTHGPLAESHDTPPASLACGSEGVLPPVEGGPQLAVYEPDPAHGARPL